VTLVICDHNKTELIVDENGKLKWGGRRPRSAERSGHFWQDEYTHGHSPNPPAPKEPLTSFPGTLARVRELEQRAARGEHLWHPDDPVDLNGFKGDFHELSIFGVGFRKEQRKRSG
jgi:hypothetical protein